MSPLVLGVSFLAAMGAGFLAAALTDWLTDDQDGGRAPR